MSVTTIDAKLLQKLFLGGASQLNSEKEHINELNVFPVPDGDTGTNMTLTILSAAREVAAAEDPDLAMIGKAMSSGALRGARGNSGVILSQLFRGFTKVTNKVETIDVAVLQEACQKAVETAYKAVMKPQEGTILTVAKMVSDKVTEIYLETDDIGEVFAKAIEAGEDALAHTPDLLPVLKQAGVVDSGGAGLMAVLHGAYDVFMGKEVDLSFLEDPSKAKAASSEEGASFGYTLSCVLIPKKELSRNDEVELKSFIGNISGEIKMIPQGKECKFTLSTSDPGKVLTKILEYGEVKQVAITNVKEDGKKAVKTEEVKAETAKDAPKKEEKPVFTEPPKEFGFISVSAGDGLSEIFKGLGVDYVIEGGQTMNPSTEDILNAVDYVNAKTIFVLPNNGNIIMAANQAASIVEGKKLVVIPTKTVPQGISAVIAFEMNKSEESNVADMTEALKAVKSGSVTYAVRDTEMDGKVIKENDIMGIGEKKILAVGQDIVDTTVELVKNLADEDSEFISVYYGADVKESDANVLLEKLEEAFPGVEVALEYGGQPVYYYVLSVE